MNYLLISATTDKVKVAQSCPILCNPMDYTVHGILQARILECVAIPFILFPKRPLKLFILQNWNSTLNIPSLSTFVLRIFMMNYSRIPHMNEIINIESLWPHGLYSPWNSAGQNTGVGCHSLLQGIFPTQGWIPGLSSQVDSLPSEPPEKPTHTHRMLNISLKTLPTRKIL